MIIFIILISICVLTTLSFFIKKKLRIKICPICIGVFMTWFILYIGLLSGKLNMVFQIPVAMMMGASVVGTAFAVEKKLKKQETFLVWKTLFISFGFGFMYNLISFNWVYVVLFAISLSIVIIFFLSFKNKEKKDFYEKNKKEQNLEERFKNCC